MTGASDGIGAVAAKKLHEMGATVALVGRTPEKTRLIANELNSNYYLADFVRLDDVRRLAKQLIIDYPRVDVLINNAGGIFGRREITEDGNEKTMQVNHLAPFLLTNILLDTLIASRAVVINTSSVANLRYGNLDINDVNLGHGYSPNRAYGNAKLANILFTMELHDRYHSHGISTAAVHPGNIATSFAKASTSLLRLVYQSPLSRILLKGPDAGAEPLVWLASTAPGVDWVSGAYYDRHQFGKVNSQASSPSIPKDFWKVSEELTGSKSTIE